jgi:hypothetical protein
MQWKSYPSGTFSTPGIVSGYEFDTLGTRGIPDGLPPLRILGRYKFIVWYTDPLGSSYNGPPTDQIRPITGLRLISSPGRPNTLATYLQQGGRLWLAGGGAAYATLIPWNRPNTPANDFTFDDGELVAGRMLYDFAHLQSAIQISTGFAARKHGSFDGPTGAIYGGGFGSRPGRGWTVGGPSRDLTQPNYSLIPDILLPRNGTTDPTPPLRNPDSFFYSGTYVAEYLKQPNFIREDLNPDPDLVTEESTLDTLYLTFGQGATLNSPVMTYYHGLDNQPFIFSGFDFWYWRRTQCIQLVDFVLNEVWRLPRQPVPGRELWRQPGTAPLSARRAGNDR